MSPNYLLPRSILGDLNSQQHADQLSTLEESFNTAIKPVLEKFLQEFKTGLSEYPTPQTKDTFLPMIPTFVQRLPNGSEEGTFLALDLGGTNLRVCAVKLLGQGKWTMENEKYVVSEELKRGTAVALFDFIARCVEHFLKSINVKASPENRLYLGFTFSFPVNQTSINRGTLINWTKGFECTGAVGEDVVLLLQDAFNRQNVRVYCAALVNDTCGAMMAAAFENGSCICGAIFGTGTNGAYLEKVGNISKMDLSTGDPTSKYMVINTEWGALDNVRDVLKFTEFDETLDSMSINPRKQAFEKMTSGMYLGEVVRNVLLSLAKSKVLFNGQITKALETHYGFDTAVMSAIEGFTKDLGVLNIQASISVIKATLAEALKLSIQDISDDDCILVYRVCELVGTRACRFAACAVAAIVLQTGSDKTEGPISFGMDGSLVEYYPRFQERLRIALNELVGEDIQKRVVINLAKDGSGVGAALVAQSAKATLEAQESIKIGT